MQGDKNQKNKPESVDLRYAKTAAGAANLLPLNERPVKHISLLSTAVRSAARLHYGKSSVKSSRFPIQICISSKL